MAKKRSPTTIASREAADHLRSLEVHGRVIEAASEKTPLPANVTHVLVKKPGAAPVLKEVRKSFF